ncbi:hypothetical protein Tco_1289753 [Tanacetum coccineum]
MERFEEAIYKQMEEINERITENFSLLKDYTIGKSEKVLVREEVGKPDTKYVNIISLVRMENNKGKEGDGVVDKSIVEPIELVEKEEVVDDIMDNESGIVDDMLVDVAGFVYSMDFVILDVKEDEYMPLILVTPFLTTARAEIRRILEWEERIENFQEDELGFSKWRSKAFDDKNLVGNNFFFYGHELKKDRRGSSVSGEGVT